MFISMKKSFLLACAILAAVAVSAPRVRFPFPFKDPFDVSTPVTAFCPAEGANIENMNSWCYENVSLKTAPGTSALYSLPDASAFLTGFVQDPEVSALLARRIEVDYSGEPRSLSASERGAIFEWYTQFASVVTLFGGSVLTPFSLEKLPVILDLKFEAVDGYTVRVLARNGFPLGFYDALERNCIYYGSKAVSQYPFPAQLISTVLYAQRVNDLSKPGIRAANAYLFAFPGTEELPLDDWDVFVLEEDVPFSIEEQEAFNADLLSREMPPVGEIGEAIRSTRIFDVSCPETYVLTSDTVIFRNLQRPALGGADAATFPNIHGIQGNSNAAVGLVSLLESAGKFARAARDRRGK